MTKAQINEELEKGYNDYLAGRIRPSLEAFFVKEWLAQTVEQAKFDMLTIYEYIAFLRSLKI